MIFYSESLSAMVCKDNQESGGSSPTWKKRKQLSNSTSNAKEIITGVPPGSRCSFFSVISQCNEPKWPYCFCTKWRQIINLFCFLYGLLPTANKIRSATFYFSKHVKVTVTPPPRRCKIYLQMLTLIKNRNSWKICTLILFVSLVNLVYI